ncbi:MAG: endonuclease Q family protein [Minisyncoccia bacterium]
MTIIADFHLHSKYSRATSRNMDLEHIYLAAREKGINIIGTGDFTHPLWLQEIEDKLEPAEDGLYQLKKEIKEEINSRLENEEKIRFIVTGEISNIYSKEGKVRRIHNVIILPSIESALKINKVLSWQGNLKSDGRPILGMSTEELIKIVFEIEPKAMFIPAHIWTPWFSLFGSMSGFDSLEEALGDYKKYITALETGLSSDPKMNWRVSELDPYSLVSNSDAHSPDNIGREANVFDLNFSYSEIRETLIKKEKNKFLYTVEFFPEEGKYHYDGHRMCKIRMSPEERKKVNSLCPVCHKPLTIGVLSRVDELATRPEGEMPSNAIPFKRLIPLKEIIAEVLNTAEKTKIVDQYYRVLINNFQNEFNVLLEADPKEIGKLTDERIGEGIERMRKEEVFIEPGYDGEYGKIKILINNHHPTNTLF